MRVKLYDSKLAKSGPACMDIGGQKKKSGAKKIKSTDQ